ncbi:MAG: hypothetical protein HYW48_03690 [Deltaproteobacteria bacterium]|nr:hypothetical protein [Deltaproteobacteria bacterium]
MRNPPGAKMQIRVRFVICLAVLMFPLGGAGQELPEHFLPVRPIGMGGAFTAIANDQNSIWTNPAGIGRIRKHRSRKHLHLLSVPNLVGGVNDQAQSFYGSFKTAGAENSGADAAANVKTAIENTATIDKPIWARAAINPVAFVEITRGTPGVFSLFSNTRLKIQVDKDDTSSAQVESVSDTGAVLGIGLTNNTNRHNLGLQVRPIFRFAYDERVDLETLTNTSEMQKRILTEGNTVSAVALDLGWMWTFADYWFPSVGVSVLNVPTGCRQNFLNPFTELRETICGTTFKGSINNEESLFLVDPTDIRVGVSLTPRIFHKVALRFAVDVHHLYLSSGDTYYGLPGAEPIKTVHGGIELFIGNPLLLHPFSARLGVSQGFVTTGVTLRVGPVFLEFASYGQDISAETTSKEDRRTLFALSLEL